jgi:hypothetical protein
MKIRMNFALTSYYICIIFITEAVFNINTLTFLVKKEGEYKMAKTTITFEIDKKLMEKFMKIVDDSVALDKNQYLEYMIKEEARKRYYFIEDPNVTKKDVQIAFGFLNEFIERYIPESKEKSVAIQSLEASRDWVEAAIKK